MALFVAQARTLYFDLPVRKTDPAVLRSVPADIAAALTRRARPGYLFGTQTQNGFDGLAPDAVDHFIDSHPSRVTSSTSGSKICPFALANSSTLATAAAASRSTIWYFFFTAVVVLSRIVFGESILTNRAATAALNLQLSLGHAHTGCTWSSRGST